MDTNVNTIPLKKPYRNGMVHFILSNSYTVFLFAVVLGVIFDMIVPIDIFNTPIYQYGGLILIMIGSILVYWAQSSSYHSKVEMKKDKTERNFAKGPYKYSRNPTHIGLTLLTLGLGFVINSLFSVIFIIITSLVTKAIFLKKEEDLLEEEYGQVYTDYKKKVNSWL